MLELSKYLIELGQLTLKIFEDVVIKHEKYIELVVGDSYKALSITSLRLMTTVICNI